MDTSKWKWFRYDEIFDINSFRGDTLQDLEEGDIPYISATEDNNGVNGYIFAEKFCEGNKITVSRNGSVGVSFYQPQKFYPSPDDVRIFSLKDNALTPYIGLFLCVLIEKERYRYTYGRKFGTNRMKTSLIKLPVTPEGTPDWQYMETFVKDQIIPQLPKKAQRVWLQKYDTKSIQQNTMKLNTQDWKWFEIKEIFEVKAGKYHYNHEYEGGNTPYLTATAVNNGVGEMISLAPEFEGGTITIEKVKCTAFYQPFPFCATSDVNIIKRKDGKPINQYVGIFLSTIIDFNESFRWTYGRQCRVNDTENIRIKLPAIKNNKDEYEPDWQFMEDYIKSLPYSKNIEPSDPKEIVDELVEMKKEMIKMRRAMEAHQSGEVHLHIDHIDTFNDNSRHISLDSGEK